MYPHVFLKFSIAPIFFFYSLFLFPVSFLVLFVLAPCPFVCIFLSPPLFVSSSNFLFFLFCLCLLLLQRLFLFFCFGGSFGSSFCFLLYMSIFSCLCEFLLLHLRCTISRSLLLPPCFVSFPYVATTASIVQHHLLSVSWFIHVLSLLVVVVTVFVGPVRPVSSH